MAQLDSEYVAAAQPPPGERRRGVALVVDLALAAIGFVALSILIPGAFLGVRAAQQGLELSQIADMQMADMLRLLGAEGVLVTLLAQNAVFVAVPLIRVALLWRESPATIGFHAARPLKLVSFGLGLGALVIAGNICLGLLFASLGIRQNQSAQYPLFAGDYLGQALFFFGAGLIAPLGEEALMRGYVFSTLSRIWGGARLGIGAAYVLSALLFSIAHSLAATEGLAGLLVPAFFMGLLLAWGMHRTGSLLPCVIAHSMNNSLALLALVTCVNAPALCPDQ